MVFDITRENPKPRLKGISHDAEIDRRLCCALFKKDFIGSTSDEFIRYIPVLFLLYLAYLEKHCKMNLTTIVTDLTMGD